ncbi:hypothetical protein YP76_18210 [Sphingobium chungbukense]|uniref:DUF2141 domain-containing protein n=1 Tax=Sphingobium chungbukense TaxID=56193 RepID=A0A0M3ALS1_9SPHN|nr:hypothetical protein YP76_18210 [Sphingobium chungbukense]
MFLACGLPVQAHAQRGIMGPDAQACEQGAGPAFLVQVRGFKKSAGDLRVQIYGSDPQSFLAKGKWLRRIDLPVSNVPFMPVCVSLPAPGAYAVAVRHDVDGNGKSGWNDGGGFSRNPSLSLFHLKPAFAKVVVSVGTEVKKIPIVLNYRRGLSIRPIEE